MSWYDYEPRPTVAHRRAMAQQEIDRRTKAGEVLAPVRVEGTKLGKTFWGRAWCDQLSRYSDYASRLPSGKSYVRNGAVIDLQISPGLVKALVVGSSVYTVEVHIDPLPPEVWANIKQEIGGQINTVVELLQGRLSAAVMEVVTRPTHGLLPTLTEVHKRCNCLDWADLCKHLAAVMYGVGVRLDADPGLLFTLRGVDHTELISAVSTAPLATPGKPTRRTIAAANLSAVFGIELEGQVTETAGGDETPKSTKLDSPQK